MSVDGEPVDLPDLMAYKALMLAGVPNFAFTIGYTNASWTLKADLVADYVCRLLAHLDEHGARSVVPVPDDPSSRECRSWTSCPATSCASLGVAAEAGRPRAVAAAPELRPRPAHDPPRPDRRRRAPLSR